MRAIQDISAYSISRSTIRVIDTDINGKRRKKPVLTLALDWFSSQRVSQLEQILLRNILLAKLYKQLQKLVRRIGTALRTFQIEQQVKFVAALQAMAVAYKTKKNIYLAAYSAFTQTKAPKEFSPVRIQLNKAAPAASYSFKKIQDLTKQIFRKQPLLSKELFSHIQATRKIKEHSSPETILLLHALSLILVSNNTKTSTTERKLPTQALFAQYLEAIQKHCTPDATTLYYATLLQIAKSEEYYWQQQQYSDSTDLDYRATQAVYQQEENKVHTTHQTEIKELLQTQLLQHLKQELGAYFSDTQIKAMIVDQLLDCILNPSTIAAQKIIERIKTMLAHMHLSSDRIQEILATLLANLSSSSIIDLTQLLSILKDTVQYQYIFGEDTHE